MMRRAIVMAGGQGTRLWPLTAARPKPLVPIANRPVMSYLLDWLVRHGIREVLVTLHYRAEDIRQAFGSGQSFGLEITYRVEEEPLGTAGSVRAASDWVDGEPFLMVSGNALTDVDLSALFQFHQQSDAWMSLGLKEVPDPSRFGVVMRNEHGRLTRFQEKPRRGSEISRLANTGIYCIEPQVLRLIPTGQPCDWGHDVFPLLLAQGLPLFGADLDGYWRDFGSFSDYAQAQQDALEGEVQLTLPATERGTRVFIGEGARIASSAVIEGPALVGAGSRVEPDALILPGSIVGEGAVVRSGACVWNATIGAGCYLGPAAVLRDCVLDDCVHVGSGARVTDGAVIGLGCRLAPGARISGRGRVAPERMLLEACATAPKMGDEVGNGCPDGREPCAGHVGRQSTTGLEEARLPVALSR